jgi:hypothetical protein
MKKILTTAAVVVVVLGVLMILVGSMLPGGTAGHFGRIVDHMQGR